MASSCRGCSKAQMCFFKILRTISSAPPSTEQQEQEQEPFPTKGVGIDLNLRFSSLRESESSRSDSASATLQNSIEEEQEGFPEKSVQLSEKPDNNNSLNNEVNDVQTASFQGRDSNCLDLLIEAARVVSGKDESDSEEERELGTELTTQRASQEKQKERWLVVDIYSDTLEEREPVVRSKRGRNQALPYRFRDSVVEPLKRATRSLRPSSTSHLTKRLLRSSSTT
ncbi:hypothetical protein PHAVU_011G090200 [Phaseolus vulgaris]|uniref:Uncharacterized protein n=1 Tax=Phaseolus vulgaris TaxID=3885 RepID=V7AJU8_PHAVU|nr:hypothetical protein PHAVU_011G090200g [Phaseolus vulgaris]XP_007132383.1 hypothetical protein PHAVU_011G090200g [Phaseolus vulgaris]ESW04376.1 hypothetical protein PHAVU_011G090200g [Phaseolus vulgaris]ESW04377.1 hypothetical protein PHAVU_011G090200g [Phaseolus vulgaris]